MAMRTNGNTLPATQQRALAVFHREGGMLRTRAALAAGINPWTLYALRDAGLIERLARGLYRVAGAEPMRAPDLATVAAKVPQAVVCLISALDWHSLTTQIPRQVHVALKRSAHKPQLPYPPVRVYWLTEPCYSAGIETHEVDGVRVRIYSPEKTLVDCFKFRRDVGLDVALEALRLYAEHGPVRTEALFEFSKLCRVRSVMRPYMEALL
jgi:predicted transcriptional regulator of viral defense system